MIDIQYIIIGIAIIICIAIIVWGVIVKKNEYKNYHYICPNCSKSFKPKSFAKSYFAPYILDDKYLKCPHCGAKKWVKGVKGVKCVSGDDIVGFNNSDIIKIEKK